VPIESVLIIVAVALIINVALVAALATPSLRDRFRRSGSGSAVMDLRPADVIDGALVDGLMGETLVGGAPPYDRVFRIVSWAFLMA
jgi:hypothetical protein